MVRLRISKFSVPTMRSIVETLPPEVLGQIFNCIETSTREEYESRYLPEPLQSSSVDSCPRYRIVSCSLAKYRLVSRQWKVVADTFFFREIAIDLEFETDDQLGNIEEFHPFNKPAAQVLRVLLRGGYTALICHLHVRFGFYRELDPDSDDSDIMVTHTE